MAHTHTHTLTYRARDTNTHTHTHTHTHIYIYIKFRVQQNLYNIISRDTTGNCSRGTIYTRRSLNKFPDFFEWALLFIVHIWNSSPLRCNLLRLQCICYTIPTTSGRPHGSPLVWACQCLSSQHLSSPQLSHNNSLWA